MPNEHNRKLHNKVPKWPQPRGVTNDPAMAISKTNGKQTKNACIIWFFQTPAYPASEEGEDRDSPARRALQEREADKPPAYKDCVKKSYTVKLPSYLKSLKEEEEGPPDYTTAVGRIV